MTRTGSSLRLRQGQRRRRHRPRRRPGAGGGAQRRPTRERSPKCAARSACRCSARRIGADEFDELISRLYNAADAGAAALADDLAQDIDLSRLMQDIPRVEDLLESQNDAPVIRLINALLTQALRDGASDIHIEPFETRSVVRFRVDGTLRDVIEPPRALHARDRLAHQDHGAARHRREAPAAGRPHHAARGGQADRRARVDAAHRARRARGAAPARQGGRAARPDAAGHGRRDARAHGHADPRAARHRPRHRPDRLGQDHDALRRAVAARSRRRSTS